MTPAQALSEAFPWKMRLARSIVMDAIQVLNERKPYLSSFAVLNASDDEVWMYLSMASIAWLSARWERWNSLVISEKFEVS